MSCAITLGCACGCRSWSSPGADRAVEMASPNRADRDADVQSIADTYVDSSVAATNFNTAVSMKVDAPSTCGLRFAVAANGGPCNRRACARGGRRQRERHDPRITSNTWTRHGHLQHPPGGGRPGIQTSGGGLGRPQFNLDGVITGDGTYNLAIDSTNSDSVYYASTNATSGQKPTLVLTVAASPNPSVTIVQPPDASSFFVGDLVTLQCTALDDEDGNLGAAVSWSSSSMLGTHHHDTLRHHHAHRRRSFGWMQTASPSRNTAFALDDSARPDHVQRRATEPTRPHLSRERQGLFTAPASQPDTRRGAPTDTSAPSRRR
jgi:hypothetical protein